MPQAESEVKLVTTQTLADKIDLISWGIQENKPKTKSGPWTSVDTCSQLSNFT